MHKLVVLLVTLVLVSSASAFVTETIYSDWTYSSGSFNYGTLGDDHTYDFASIVDFHRGEHQDYGNNGLWFFDDFSWNHSLPRDVTDISSAKLFIDGAFIDNNNNEVAIQGAWSFDSLNDDWWPSMDNDNTLIDLSHVGSSTDFWVDPFTVSVDYSNNTNWFGWATEFGLRIDQSILMIDNTNGTGGMGDTSAVPEPSTLILIGLGLAGIGAVRKKMK